MSKYSYDEFLNMPLSELEKNISSRVLGQTQLVMAEEVHQNRIRKENIDQTMKLVEVTKVTAKATWWLMFATWGLVLVTGLLVLITFLNSPNK